MRIPLRTIQLMLFAGGLVAGTSSPAVAEEPVSQSDKTSLKSQSKSKKIKEKKPEKTPESAQTGAQTKPESKPEPRKDGETKPRAADKPNPLRDACLACGRG